MKGLGLRRRQYWRMRMRRKDHLTKKVGAAAAAAAGGAGREGSRSAFDRDMVW